MTNLTVGIIGAGSVGKRHAAAFSSLAAEAGLIGVVDTDGNRAAGIAGEIGTKHYTDYRELLSQKPDLVVVCTPHFLHREIGEAAAKAGWRVAISILRSSHTSSNSARPVCPSGRAAVSCTRGRGWKPWEYARGTLARRKVRTQARSRSRWELKRMASPLANVIRSRWCGTVIRTRVRRPRPCRATRHPPRSRRRHEGRRSCPSGSPTRSCCPSRDSPRLPPCGNCR